MPGTSKKISDLDAIVTMHDDDLVEVSNNNSGTYSSVKATVADVADHVAKTTEFTNDLDTTDKTLVGAINEVAGDIPTTVAELSDASDYATVASLATVATTGSYNSLTDKPTIPADQVNADWDAVSGVAQILNKPTIPAAQVNSDWSSNSGVSQILNKPTLAAVATSGSYNDLTSKPTIPDGLADLTDDVNITSPTDGQVLKYDNATSKWVNGTGGGGGASALNDLTDVTITSATEGQVLKYDSTNSKWINGSGGGYVEPQAQTITLLENSWTATTSPMAEGYTITVAVTGVTTTSNQEILPLEVEDANDVANNDALVHAQIADAGQTTGYITLFAKNLPTDDLQIRVIVRA